jgi:hypothetical protein
MRKIAPLVFLMLAVSLEDCAFAEQTTVAGVSISADTARKVATAANAGPPHAPKRDHPILGTWIFAVPGTNCHETYYIRPDGRTLVTSGEEVAESVYQIADEPSPKGFFKSTDKTVKDNGKKDCSGVVTPVGQESTNYIRFHPSGDMMIMCRDESLNACFGPLRRDRGQDT